jgi:Helix-turn-helix domain
MHHKSARCITKVQVVKPFLIKAIFLTLLSFLAWITLNKLEYNFALLKATRLSKKITAQSIAFDLCLAERHIKSIEENSTQYFASESIRISCIKKYALALGLELEDVFESNK